MDQADRVGVRPVDEVFRLLTKAGEKEMKKVLLSRRHFLGTASMSGMAVLLAACQPKVVEKIVKETVVVQQFQI